jgi:hypothetical protein
VQPGLVEPVDPGQGPQLEVVDGADRAFVTDAMRFTPDGGHLDSRAGPLRCPARMRWTRSTRPAELDRRDRLVLGQLGQPSQTDRGGALELESCATRLRPLVD